MPAPDEEEEIMNKREREREREGEREIKFYNHVLCTVVTKGLTLSTWMSIMKAFLLQEASCSPSR